ncbi:hypothetical protein N7532_008370 [Penicillium argentinense]|uniref:Uncharacterized protein n=1 Tax=Penicillium argentinense TaxID=1131581 RepID=A0A9W9K1Y6_9EURO|nr:uncharacterized protein N7532_008370 [Penicillium argentinense]KAJ5089686.1 hypothetical protein N7532_008370 [Penicillium argentinense]
MLFPTAPDYFLRTMISAAMETPHLLYALLAIACSHHGRLVKDSTPKPKMTCLKYTNLAISNLRETIKSQDQSLKAETVTTAMVLCTNDVCNGNMQAWRTHLRGVLRLLAARLEHQKDFDATEEPFIWALTKWFKTMDIIAALSGFDGVCIHDPGNGPLDKSPSTENVYIDDICGYSLVLIPLLARVSELVRLQSLRHVPSGIDSSNGPSLETMVEIGALETKILSLSDKIAPSGTEEKDKHLAIELKSTHLAFVHTALLHLHRRVQLLPTHHSKVRLDIENILDALNNIQPSSPANILILWPIFSAGCETTIVTERDMIQERMTKMQGLGMGNFTRARELLQRFWESESNLPWDIYFAQHGLELVLF